MLDRCLPLPTPYDPAEDPPGSIDPLGTVTTAEQLAEILFPGLTSRMWRVRHLTFTALAALLAERAAAKEGGNEDLRLEARLGLERLFVSSIARKESHEDGWQPAAKRLPGISLARRAIQAGNQPLGKQNFLKGQAINGPFGVVQRLARNLDIIDNDNRLSRNGEQLLLEWSAEQGLDGILDEENSGSPGAKWLKRIASGVVRHVQNGWWPGGGWSGWDDLATLLRPDTPDSRERAVLFQLLTDPVSDVRKRSIELLLSPATVQAYRAATTNGSAGGLDQMILAQELPDRIRGAEEDVDRLILYTANLIDSFEQLAGHLESAFRGLLWALTHRGGRSTVDQLLADPSLAQHIDTSRDSLAAATTRFHSLMSRMPEHPQVAESIDSERLDGVLQDALAGVSDRASLVQAVMDRHARVQQQKKKGVWVERDEPHWTLMPGFGDSEASPPDYSGTYLHPFRISNAYSFLSDLGRVRGIRVPDAEEN
ncbi:MAG: hypothetical protein DWQ34_06775 [Planctomycetota bacterium]|nr:MAG: hypothetical protein DWQ29_17420 [Planctomycetota bacterium]REJ95226.1 MAG: hypothetical protein DWQ34_06775 [Planctomycetota bacterium]REK25071.1 MAG: hypothetical protein DWQ41_12925 [Planctomycetota bacterium]REK28136.1 MAG: hypothetical protein DWQ45_25250 [Planctomycetota bacterium]